MSPTKQSISGISLSIFRLRLSVHDNLNTLASEFFTLDPTARKHASCIVPQDHANLSFDLSPPIARPHYTILPRMDTGETFALIERWIAKCSEEPELCRRALSRSNKVPTRLLKIHTLSVNLIMTRDDPRCGSYATLGHCWGLTQMVKLTDDTFESLQAGSPISDLPRTFREAIGIWQSLGFKYLWMDSFCIKQDSKEDWV
jgi:hypothetical protein